MTIFILINLMANLSINLNNEFPTPQKNTIYLIFY